MAEPDWSIWIGPHAYVGPKNARSLSAAIAKVENVGGDAVLRIGNGEGGSHLAHEVYGKTSLIRAKRAIADVETWNSNQAAIEKAYDKAEQATKKATVAELRAMK